MNEQNQIQSLDLKKPNITEKLIENKLNLNNRSKSSLDHYKNTRFDTDNDCINREYLNPIKNRYRPYQKLNTSVQDDLSPNYHSDNNFDFNYNLTPV